MHPTRAADQGTHGFQGSSQGSQGNAEGRAGSGDTASYHRPQALEDASWAMGRIPFHSHSRGSRLSVAHSVLMGHFSAALGRCCDETQLTKTDPG